MLRTLFLFAIAASLIIGCQIDGLDAGIVNDPSADAVNYKMFYQGMNDPDDNVIPESPMSNKKTFPRVLQKIISSRVVLDGLSPFDRTCKHHMDTCKSYIPGLTKPCCYPWKCETSIHGLRVCKLD